MAGLAALQSRRNKVSSRAMVKREEGNSRCSTEECRRWGCKSAGQVSQEKEGAGAKETFQAVAMWPGCESAIWRAGEAAGDRVTAGVGEQRVWRGKEEGRRPPSAPPSRQIGKVLNRIALESTRSLHRRPVLVRREVGGNVRVAKGGCSIVFGSTSPRTPPLRVPLVPTSVLSFTACRPSPLRRPIWRGETGCRVEVKVGRGRWRDLALACELDGRLAWPQL